jgi:hypothetical protein
MTCNDTVWCRSDRASDPYSGLNCGRGIFIATGNFPWFSSIYVESDVLTAVAVKCSIFWNIMPYIQAKVNRRFGGTYRYIFQGRRVSETRRQHGAGKLALFFVLVPCLSSSSSTLKMRETCPSETSVDFQWITRYYIPEDRTLHIHRYEKLESHLLFWTLCISDFIKPITFRKLILFPSSGEEDMKGNLLLWAPP